MNCRPLVRMLLGTALAIWMTPAGDAGEVPANAGYKVLAPIQQGNLSVFPVVAAKSHDTRDFLTLDEGLRSGEVVVTESGSVATMVRQRPGTTHNWREHSGPGAQVNQLVLTNSSKRPLLLLAGEIVTGGKQDRVIAKDRIVPAESGPVDLGVFCVEPGRWVGNTAKFQALGTAMAQPRVRSKAMANKDQSMVWAEVGNARAGLMAVAPPAAKALEGNSSYARAMQNSDVSQKVDSMAGPVQRGYQSLIQRLRESNAVGVVVAVNGELVWADVFASTQLLQKYWPKLVRSYATEALVTGGQRHEVDVKSAQVFLDKLEGRREVAETEPGLYRHTEVSGDTYKVFELTSLLPKTGFELHIAKMME